MIDYLALSSDTTRASTRVQAFLVAASLVLGTVGANCALWSAGRWRTDEAGYAAAHCLLVNYATDAVGSAGGRVAGVLGS